MAPEPARTSAVDDALSTLRHLRGRLESGIRSEQDLLDTMVDLCEAFDEIDRPLSLGGELPSAWRQGRAIKSVAEMRALPVGAVILSSGDEPGVHEQDNPEFDQWYKPGEEMHTTSEYLVPALLLWHPEWAKQ